MGTMIKSTDETRDARVAEYQAKVKAAMIEAGYHPEREYDDEQTWRTAENADTPEVGIIWRKRTNNLQRDPSDEYVYTIDNVWDVRVNWGGQYTFGETKAPGTAAIAKWTQMVDALAVHANNFKKASLGTTWTETYESRRPDTSGFEITDTSRAGLKDAQDAMLESESMYIMVGGKDDTWRADEGNKTGWTHMGTRRFGFGDAKVKDIKVKRVFFEVNGESWQCKISDITAAYVRDDS